MKGNTITDRFTGGVRFEFPKGFLQSASVDQVTEAIRPLLASESESKKSETKTIALDQTQTEVEAVLGVPDRVIDLRTKVTWVYKDMKVVFVDGKVSDVQ